MAINKSKQQEIVLLNPLFPRLFIARLKCDQKTLNYGQVNKNTQIKTTPATHCSVSSNSFHRQIIQKAVHQITDPENKKCSH